MRTASSKLDNSVHERVIARCNGLGCTVSKYISDLIDRDLESDDEMQSSDSGQFIRHRSNPDIKLVKSIVKNGDTRYIDTEGREWHMKKDMTLIPIARLRWTSQDESSSGNEVPRATWRLKLDGTWVRLSDDTTRKSFQ
jgi:hypothetical protein